MDNPLLGVKIRDLMTSDVIAIDQGAKVVMALDLMHEKNLRRLPVIGRLGHLVGMLTLAEAQAAMPQGVSHFEGGEQEDHPIPEIRTVMDAQFHSVTPNDTAARAAQLMLRYRADALPVLDEEKLVGIITETDIFRFLTQDLPPIPEEWS